MIDVQYYTPDSSIQWLVKQFETIWVKDEQQISDKFIPMPYASLVFHFKSCPSLIEPLNVQLSPFFIAPLVRTRTSIRIEGELDTLIVSCLPSVLSRIFQVDLSPVSDISIAMPEDIFTPVWNKLKIITDTSDRIHAFNLFVNDLHPTTYQKDEIDLLYENIVKNCIQTPLAEIIAGCNCPVRTLQYQFLKRIGISPKSLSRIVRVNYLWDRIQHNMATDFQDLVFDCNYYDQAHLIHDFKAITGETPRHFFRRNLTTVKFLSGRNFSVTVD